MGDNDSHHGALVTTRHATSNCPTCGAGFDAASAVDGEDVAPKPGDISVCLYCGEWLMFDDDTLPTLKPTEEEMKQASAALLVEAREMRARWNARMKH